MSKPKFKVGQVVFDSIDRYYAKITKRYQMHDGVQYYEFEGLFKLVEQKYLRCLTEKEKA